VVNDGHHPDEQVEKHGQPQYLLRPNVIQNIMRYFSTHFRLAEVEENLNETVKLDSWKDVTAYFYLFVF
jgi:hypothetical protein